MPGDAGSPDSGQVVEGQYPSSITLSLKQTSIPTPQLMLQAASESYDPFPIPTSKQSPLIHSQLVPLLPELQILIHWE